jgi:hypothetical protein
MKVRVALAPFVNVKVYISELASPLELWMCLKLCSSLTFIAREELIDLKNNLQTQITYDIAVRA